MTRALVVAALVAGCAPSDPCDGRSGSCIVLTVMGDVQGIDGLAVTVDQPAPAIKSTPSAPITLPFSLGLNLPASVEGVVNIGVAAVDASGASIANGKGQAMVIDHRGSAIVTVSAAGAPDGGAGGDGPAVVLDLAGCAACGTQCCTAQQRCMSAMSTMYCCEPGALDLPDDNFVDENCDGIDGDVADAIFIDPMGRSDSSGDGTMSHPFQTLGAVGGVPALAKTQDKHQILISTGSANAATTIQLADGVSIYGGYDASQSWTRSDAIPRPTITVAAGGAAVAANGLTVPTTIDRVVLVGPSATGAGTSAYGVLVTSSAGNMTISNAAITAGNGAAGANAVTPAQTNQGATGQAASMGLCCFTDGNCTTGPSASCSENSGGGGVNSATACGGDPIGYGGGNGVGGSTSATNGNGPAGVGMGGAAGSPGNQGAAGMAGSAGDGGGSFGAGNASGYVPADGGFGTSGAPGSGGGGSKTRVEGGCFGATVFCGQVWSAPNNNEVFGGSGGGAGGCPGHGAPAGGGGGGSFAIFLFDASPTLRAVRLTTGSGGRGGNGAAGGMGGAGGGSSPPAAYGTAASLGGDGGAGGPGGGSGGGGGGPSLCVAATGSSTPSVVGAPVCQAGTGGGGGMGSTLGTNDGQVGRAGMM